MMQNLSGCQDVAFDQLCNSALLLFFSQSNDNSKLDLSNEWELNEIESQLLRLKKQ